MSEKAYNLKVVPPRIFAAKVTKSEIRFNGLGFLKISKIFFFSLQQTGLEAVDNFFHLS